MILDHMPQLTAQILVEGNILKEYDDEDAFPAKDHRTKYIEAEEGRNFIVRVMTNSRMAKASQDCVAFWIYIDGKSVGGNIISTGDKYARQQWADKHGLERNTATGSTIEKFCFTNLQTNDGPVGKAKQADYKNLGEIEVRCYWVRMVRDSSDTRSDGPSIAPASVPEKCLKGRAISSQATLGATERRTFKIIYTELEYPYSKQSFATFTFKYRSRRDLQIEGIIPRSPTPVPLEERDPNTLTLEESRELVRRMRERECEQQTEIKKEGQKKSAKRARSQTLEVDSDDEAVLITGERPAQKRSRQSTDSGVEIVDLTED